MSERKAEDAIGSETNEASFHWGYPTNIWCLNDPGDLIGDSTGRHTRKECFLF